MTAYYTNFSGSTEGAQPTGWTEFGTGGIAALKYVPSPDTASLNDHEVWLQSVYTDVYSYNAGFYHDASSADSSSADCDILVSLRVPVGLSSRNAGIIGRGSGAGQITNGYIATIAASSSGAVLRLGKFVSNAWTQLASVTLTPHPLLNSAAVHYKLRLRCNGTSISVTAWPRNASEPSPQLSVTDSSISAQGYIGVVAFNEGATRGRTALAIEAFAVDVGGEVAAITDTLPATMDDLDAFWVHAITVFNYPSVMAGMETFHTIDPTTRQPENGVRSHKMFVIGVVNGRIAKPKQSAWTYTLDGHDYYVLRLGDDHTLVYDLATDQWADWGETESYPDGSIKYDARWKLSTGFNWRGLGPLESTLGSNVVVGDDTFGALHVLDPEFPYDYQVDHGDRPFQRITQGMLTAEGRGSYQIWGVQLSGSIGEQADDALTSVELLSSDDLGHTYYSHGVNTLTPGQYDVRVDWNSLGTMRNPGRLFKLVDMGLTRVDSLESYDAKS